MCRWFAYISATEPALLDDVLIDPDHCIAKQVATHYLPFLDTHEATTSKEDTEKQITMRNKLFNADGFGATWYTAAAEDFGEVLGQRPVLYHVMHQPLTDPTFRSICSNTSSKTIFAHIRAASGATAINTSNNHPFVWGRYSFMHNGAIGNFSELRVPLLNKMSLPAQQHINGTTDSEHFAMLFFSCLADRVGTHGPAMLDQSWALADMKAALEQALTTLFAVQRDVVGAERIERSSLNVAVTDGEQLLAMRFRNAGPDEFPPSLYYTTTAGVILNRKYAGDPDHPDKSVWNSRLNAQPRSVESHGKHVIVASEPTTYHDEDWKLIDKNHCIMVGRDMEPSVVPIDVSF